MEDKKGSGRIVPKEEMRFKLSVSTIIKGMQLVESGQFVSFEQVVEEAIVNLTKKTPAPQNIKDDIIEYSAINKEDVVLDLSDIAVRDCSNIVPASAIEPARLADKLLPFTVQRLLPVKYCLRLLVSELCKSGNDYVDLEKFKTKVFTKAIVWRNYLERLDTSNERPRGERLSSTFPAASSDPIKSNKRFFNSIVGYRYADGRLTGALLFLGFATIEGERNNRLRITNAGLRFALLTNPVIDDKKNAFPPFAEEEKDLLLNHLAERCPIELSHTVYYLKILKEKPGIGRRDLLYQMRSFYERTWNPLDLTQAMVDSLRAGVNGRCTELGLTVAKKEGKVASYNLTPLGLKWIESVEKEMRA